MITGNQFRDAVISGANTIAAYRKEVDELNVFPVPDGDTGTNMSMTIGNAARQLPRLQEASLEQAAAETASCLLRGARGNSGVILSLLFRGIAKGCKGLEEADGVQLASALAAGVDAAYRAVMKPTEGTILTVARIAAEQAKEAARQNNDPVFVWEVACAGAKQALDQTPELLPVLKKAGVVDAGGRGLLFIFEGMLSVFRDGVIAEARAQQPAEPKVEEPSNKTAVQEFEGEITFTYCTEYIVKRDPAIERDPLLLRAFLESIGDCVVVVDDESIIKVHVHSDNPGLAIQEGLKFGELVNMKIDYMREQNERFKQEQSTAPATTEEGEVLTPAEPEKPYGFVAVAAGEGLNQLFTDLGADRMVQGGQTMNPSTDDILRAIEATPAETVFVLPNNKNIIMAAEQAGPLATRKVHVLPTRTIPMGISAILAFDETADVEENLLAMTKAADNVGTGQITYAARDSEYDGHTIKKGEIMALENGKVAFIEQDMVRAVTRLCKALHHKNSSMITIFYGQDVTEELAEQARAAVEQKLPGMEIAVVNGGQPVYYFILSVE